MSNALARGRMLRWQREGRVGPPLPQDACAHAFRVTCPDCDKRFHVDHLVATIALRDVTVARLKEQLRDEIREGQRAAREAYAEGEHRGRTGEEGY